jgi:hypothetical protein
LARGVFRFGGKQLLAFPVLRSAKAARNPSDFEEKFARRKQGGTDFVKKCDGRGKFSFCPLIFKSE